VNKIETLLHDFCPEGVLLKTLGSISTLSNNGVDKKLITGEEEINLLNYMDVYRNRKLNKNNLSMVVTASEKKRTECNIKKGDIFITPSSETKEDLAKASVVTEDIPNAVYSYHIMRIRFNSLKEVNPTFIAYLFESRLIQEEIMQLSTGMTRYGLTKPKWESLKFPLPPIEIQNEIAKILDTFSGLEVELKKELEAELETRKKQYGYFKESLFTFKEDETREVLIREICDISRGTVISKGYLRDHSGSYPVYSSQTLNQGIFGYIDSYAYDFESFTWTTDGANAGAIFYHKDEKFTITNVCGLLKVREPKAISTRYLYYLLSTEAPKYVSPGMGNPKIMAGTMGDIKIALPSIERQHEIVNLLDLFNKSLNEISIDLPAEIKARRSQYEYYLEKLLTFKEMESS
jgi:type I restriction enzyme S subunit